MKEIQESLQEIRESQVRMESDLRYHIRRTDLLEHQIQEQRAVMAPLYAFDWFNNYRFLLFLMTMMAGIIYIINKKI
jgi:hypothetical protein